MSKYKSDIGLVISDLHLGETVFAAQVQGLNETNHQILANRFKYTISNALHLLDHHVGSVSFDTFHLMYAGDMVSGERHPEHVETNDLTIAEQLQKAVLLENHGVTEIGLWCKQHDVKLRVHCVMGNHGDLASKHPSKNQYGRNLDWMSYWQCYDYCSKKLIKLGVNVEFDIPDGLSTEFHVGKRLFRLMHGHTPARFGGRGDGPLGPAGPMCRLDVKQRRQAASIPGRPVYQTLICGHWHHYFATETVIGNGSLIGYNEYAIQLGFPYEPPTQALFLVHPQYGVTHQIKVCATKNNTTII